MFGVNKMGFKEFLGLSALFLSIINGSILLRNYLRDKPKLTVHPINPDVYQWWFKLPDEKIENKLIRKYGFLVYIEIVNRGLRKVSLESWKLYIRTIGFKQIELDAISIPEPKGNIGKSEHLKFWPVLGQKGPLFDTSTFIDSGNCISGMAYYVLKIYDEEIYTPIIKDEKVNGKLIIKNVFGEQSNCDISFSKKSLKEITSIVEDIEKIV